MKWPRGVGWAWIGLGLAVAAIHLTAVSGEFGGHFGGDNAGYFLLARALATGQGYVDIYHPLSPPNTHYPFLFPLLLAPFHLMFKQPLLPMHVMVALASAAAAVALGRFARRRTGSEVFGLALGLAAAIMPRYYLQSGHLLSEPVYTLCCYLALLALAGTEGKTLRPGRLAVLTALALAAYFTRSAGVALGLALVVALGRTRVTLAGRERGLTAAPILAAIFILVGLAWWLRNYFAAGSGSAYLGQLVAQDPYQLERRLIGATGLGQRIAGNAKFYFPMLGFFLFYPSRRLPPGLGTALGWLGFALFALGLVREWRQGQRAGPVFVVASLAIMLVWPFTEDRFLLPLLPLGLFYFFRALQGGLEWWPREKAGKAILAFIALAWLIANGWFTHEFIRMRFSDGWMPKAPVYVAGYGDWSEPVVNWAKYDVDFNDPRTRNQVYIEQMTQYIVMNRVANRLVPEEKIIASRKPIYTYLWSDRKSVVLPDGAGPDELWSYLQQNRVAYVLTQGPGGAFEACRQSRPERFILIAEIPPEGPRLYEVDYGSTLP
jgi:hypothetical protein